MNVLMQSRNFDQQFRAILLRKNHYSPLLVNLFHSLSSVFPMNFTPGQRTIPYPFPATDTSYPEQQEKTYLRTEHYHRSYKTNRTSG